MRHFLIWAPIAVPAIGLLGAIAIIALVFATGSTFGQRCARVYAAPLAQERCVARLDNGGPI